MTPKSRYARHVKNHPRFGDVLLVRLRDGGNYYSDDGGISWWIAMPEPPHQIAAYPQFNIICPKTEKILYHAK